MAIEIRNILKSLRVEATMEASGYTAGANAKVASDAKMVESGGRVAGSLEQTDRRLNESGSRFERLDAIEGKRAIAPEPADAEMSVEAPAA